MMAATQIPNDLKMGREYALLGKYDIALVYYEGAADALKKQVKTSSGATQERWQTAVDQVGEEFEYLKTIKTELTGFMAPPPKPDVQDAPEDPDVWGPPPPRSEYHAPPRAQAPPQRRQQAPSRARAPPARSSAAPSRNAAPSRDPGRNVGGLYKGEGGGPSRRGPSRKAPLDTGRRGSKAKAGGDNSRAPGEDDGKKKAAFPTDGWDEELVKTLERDIVSTAPNVHWDDIAGNAEAKRLLEEAVVLPLLIPDYFTGIRRPWKGVLMTGPPGTGKTLLAKAVATECGTTFFNISASTVVSKWRGDSEKLIRVLFDLARHHQPSTIFIDELDSLMGARGEGGGEHEGSRRMKTELLIQMDGLLRDTKDQVFLLGASNLPWDLDSAMLRRLEKRVLVNLPTVEARESMLKCYLPEPFAEGLDYAKLASLTEEWSGSDIRLLCKEAAMHPLRRLMAQMEMDDMKPQQ